VDEGDDSGQVRAACERGRGQFAVCGEMAAVVKAVPAGGTPDMGPPLGRQSQDRDGIVVDYFGGTTWKHADAPVYQAVRQIRSGDAPDPATLRRIDWELAPFYCPDYGQNYCRADWRSAVLLDGGSYDCTMGRCPSRPRTHDRRLNRPQVWAMAAAALSRVRLAG